jgi:hypothetical protein
MLDRNTFLWNHLSRAWQNTYEKDPWAIHRIEDQWQCAGFSHASDRHIHFDSSRAGFENGCFPFLDSEFGCMIYRWAMILWVIKCLQVPKTSKDSRVL